MVVQTLRWCLIIWAVAQLLWMAMVGVPSPTLSANWLGTMSAPRAVATATLEVLHGALPPVILVLIATVLWRCSRGTMPLPALPRSRMPMIVIAATFLCAAVAFVVFMVFEALIDHEPPLIQMFRHLLTFNTLRTPVLGGAVAWLLSRSIAANRTGTTAAAAERPAGVRLKRRDAAYLATATATLVALIAVNIFTFGVIAYAQFDTGMLAELGPWNLPGPIPVSMAILTAVSALGRIAFIVLCLSFGMMCLRHRHNPAPLLHIALTAPEAWALAATLILKAPAMLGSWLYRALTPPNPMTTAAPAAIPLEWIDALCWPLIFLFVTMMIGRILRTAWKSSLESDKLALVNV